jgi:hypothetical protein
MIGRADAVRVANDVAWAWSPGGVGNMLQESYADQYFNHVLFALDPDVLYVRDYKSELTEDEVYSISLWDGMLGGSVNTSDRFDRVRPERLKLWRFVQPTREHRIAKLPFWANKRDFYVAVREYGRAWGVLFVNDKQRIIEEEYGVEELVGRGQAYCYKWLPGKSLRVGAVSQLKVELRPHESVLYYLAVDDEGPAPDMAISGIKVAGLAD